MTKPTPGQRVTVDAYHRLIEAGVLDADDKVELLEEVIVQRFRKTPQHVFATGTLTDTIDRLIPPGWHTRNHTPVTTADSEPEPDVSLVRGDIRDYGERHPNASDVGLIAEVADQSLERDRQLKARIYARAGVATYWIVNLVDRVVEVYSDPRPSPEPAAYAAVERFGDQMHVPLWLDGSELGRVSVADLLP